MIALRPLRAVDGAAFQQFVRDLSPESRLQRFFAPVRELAPRLLAALTQPDQRAHFALAATAGAKIIGEGRYVVAPGTGGRAEFAIAVADGWQRHGIGARLLGALTCAAKRAGVTFLQGEVLRGNDAMLKFLERGAFRLKSCPGDARLLLADKRLNPG